MSSLQLRLFGPPHIEVDNKPIQLKSRKAVALLAFLAVSGQEHSRDSLATMLWPDQSQSKARAYLRNVLWMFNPVRLDEWFEASQETIRVRTPFELDVAKFTHLITQRGQHGHTEDEVCPNCLPLLENAAALYTGDFMAGFTLRDCPEFDDWQFFQSDSLRQKFSEVLECLVRLYDDQKEWEKATRHARRWVALDPLHEPAHRWLMRIYASNGKRELALKQYETLTQTLDQELGLKPEEDTHSLYREIFSKRFPEGTNPVVLTPLSTPQSQPTYNLPAQRTSFIGRERELEAIKSLIQSTSSVGQEIRLLTLTGPGGSGKTRLALEAAAELTSQFQDGVFFVNLTPLDNPDLVPSAIARAIGLVETPGREIFEMLKAYLKDRQVLLVLDNFEHLIEAAVFAADLLSAAPKIKILATSREVLQLYGEQILPIPPLALPPSGNPSTVEELTQYEAVQLFIERARAARPDLDINESTVQLMAEICTILDGLPLAIELAAARLRLTSLGMLRSQLSGRLSSLGGGPRDAHFRQRTLRATIDWSYNLLSEDEKKLLARLSVFQGASTMEAIEQVCGESLNSVEGIESLLGKSLVQQVGGPDGDTRFNMLEMVREYANQKLEDSGEQETLRKRHAHYYYQLVEQAEPYLRGGSRLVEWLRCLEDNLCDLRAALDWTLGGGDIDLGLRLAGSSLWFWVRQDHHSEGRFWIDRALENSDGAPPSIRARLWFADGASAYFQQDTARSLASYRKAVHLFREAGKKRELGWGLAFLGATLGMVERDQYTEAIRLCEEGLAILRELDDRQGIAQALNYIGELARTQNDYERARATYEESLSLACELEDPLREQMLYTNLGYIAVHEQEYDLAAALFESGLDLAIETDMKSNVANSFMALAGIAAIWGRPEQGALLMGSAQSLLDSTGVVLQPADLFEIENYDALIRDRLDPSDYQQAWEEGRRMSLEEAVSCARELIKD